MAEEAKDDLKKEETPAGDGQPAKDIAGPEAGVKKEPADDTVVISKAELAKITEARDNYREGLLSERRKGRTLPGSEPVKQPSESEEDEDLDGEREEKFVTKTELTQRDDKEVIRDACKDPDVDENWGGIMEYYIPPKDTSKESKQAAVQKAIKLWKLENPKKEPDKGKMATADLAADKGLGLGKEKNPPPTEKKRIIPKKEKMEDWYGK